MKVSDLEQAKTNFKLLHMPADVIKQVNRMAQKTWPDLLFADRHNVIDVISAIPLEPYPDSTISISITVDINVPLDDKSTDDNYDPKEDDDASDTFPTASDDNSIVCSDDSSILNDEITGVDMSNNFVDDILFPVHEAEIPEMDTAGVDGVDTSGMDDVELPGVPDTNDNDDSDDDSDSEEHYPIQTRCGRTV